MSDRCIEDLLKLLENVSRDGGWRSDLVVIIMVGACVLNCCMEVFAMLISFTKSMYVVYEQSGT